MMKLVVLCCMLAAAVASVPYSVVPVASVLSIPSQYGYVVPLQHPYNSAAHLTKAFNTGLHVLNKRSVTRLPVAPGPVGFSAAVAAGNIGISSPLANDPTGLSGNIVASPIGILTPLNVNSIGLSTPIVAGSFSITAPITRVAAALNASPIGISPAPIAVTAPLTTGTSVVSAPIAAPIVVSGSTTPIIRSF